MRPTAAIPKDAAAMILSIAAEPDITRRRLQATTLLSINQKDIRENATNHDGLREPSSSRTIARRPTWIQSQYSHEAVYEAEC